MNHSKESPSPANDWLGLIKGIGYLQMCVGVALVAGCVLLINPSLSNWNAGPAIIAVFLCAAFSFSFILAGWLTVLRASFARIVDIVLFCGLCLFALNPFTSWLLTDWVRWFVVLSSIAMISLFFYPKVAACFTATVTFQQGIAYLVIVAVSFIFFIALCFVPVIVARNKETRIENQIKGTLMQEPLHEERDRNVPSRPPAGYIPPYLQTRPHDKE